ncbi:hypothetical protein TNCV_492471 [Trichonephila clavipes]|nr:hypothetical protein TNCV_492471 [Trichonephila clavipes]
MACAQKNQASVCSIFANSYPDHYEDLTIERGGCDEAHFWLNGNVNKQNCRIWSEANPQVYVETPLHPEKLTVGCALWDGGIIGPYCKEQLPAPGNRSNERRYR